MQKKTSKEQINEAHALAQSIPFSLTAKRKQELKLRVIELLSKVFK